MKVPACTSNHWWLMQKVKCSLFISLTWGLMLYKCQNKWDSTTESINIAPSSDICVFFYTYNGSPLFMESLVGLSFLKSISSNRNALDQCWKDSSLECTVADWINKAKPKGERRGEARGDVWELSLPTVQLIEIGLGFNFTL